MRVCRASACTLSLGSMGAFFGGDDADPPGDTTGALGEEYCTTGVVAGSSRRRSATPPNY